MKNGGVLHEPPRPDHGFFGGISSPLPVLLEDGNWEPYLPDTEGQRKFEMESYNCVQFSRLNVCEMLAKFYGRMLALSDRFLAWASGCMEYGNTFSNCDWGLKNRGCCGEGRWPWLVPLTWSQYVAEPPEEVKAEALRLLDEWDFGMLHNVPLRIDDLREALKRGPVWFCNSNHAMAIYAIDDRIRAFDTYGSGRKSFDLGYVEHMYAAYLAPMTPKDKPYRKPMDYPENCLVVVTDGHGERYMNVDNTRLYFDDAGKVDLELQARNSKPCPIDPCPHCRPGRYVPHTATGTIPVVHVTSADVAKVPKVNFKNEPV